MSDSPVVMSTHFPDPADAEAVRKAAEAMKLSPSAFLRDAALKAAAAAGRCPTCGAPRKRSGKKMKKAKAPSKGEAVAA